MPTRSNELEIGSDTTLDNPNKSTSKEWKLKNVQWKQVWRRQDHANLVLLAGLIVGVAVASFAVDPRDSYYYIYDATISYPKASKHGFDPTVPNWVSIIIPLLNMLMTIIVGEFVYSKREHHSLTDAFAVLIYFLLDGLQSLVCALLVTQATKVSVGWLRPDFFARCEPVIPENITIQYGQDVTSEYPCTSTDSGVIDDGRQSFPSGHTSFSFNLATYASAYLIWCWNMRREWVPRSLPPMQEFLSDLRNVVAKVWMLLMLAIAWGISMSRIIDNQHHPADVVGGMALGVLIALIYITRAIPRYTRVLTDPNSKKYDKKLIITSSGGNAISTELDIENPYSDRSL